MFLNSIHRDWALTRAAQSFNGREQAGRRRIDSLDPRLIDDNELIEERRQLPLLAPPTLVVGRRTVEYTTPVDNVVKTSLSSSKRSVDASARMTRAAQTEISAAVMHNGWIVANPWKYYRSTGSTFTGFRDETFDAVDFVSKKLRKIR